MRGLKPVLFALLLISAALKGENVIILGQAGTEGELAFPRQVEEGPDGMLFFTEFFGGHPWITIVELDGKLSRVIKPQVKKFFGISRAVSLARDTSLYRARWTGGTGCF